jgi:hypothetical protein
MELKSTFYPSRFAQTHVHVSNDLMPLSARNNGRRQSEQIEGAFNEGRSARANRERAPGTETQGEGLFARP